MHPMARKKAAGWAHQYLRPFIKSFKPVKLRKNEFVAVELEIHDVIGKGDWDVSNKWPWIKWFEDTLVEMRKLPDDCVRYVRDSGRIIFYEIADAKDKKLVFNVYKMHR